MLGATGMLGPALVAEACHRQMEVVAAGRSGPDIEVDVRDENVLRDAFAHARPTLVVNSAAMIDIGTCESHPELAYAVNARAVALLAELCHEHSARLIQVSTDHYFAGDGRAQHDEAAAVRLINEYARTKFAGEAFALSRPDSLVIRTNITGFRGRSGSPTFVEWAIAAIEAGKRMTLFNDFYTSTMATGDCAVALFDLIESGASGLFNVASAQVSSKREFVTALADSLGCPLNDPISGSVRGLRPPRAESLGLDVSRTEQVLSRQLPDLQATVKSLIATRPAPA